MLGLLVGMPSVLSNLFYLVLARILLVIYATLSGEACVLASRNASPLLFEICQYYSYGHSCIYEKHLKCDQRIVAYIKDIR